MKVIITSPILPFCLCLLFEAEAATINCSCQSVYSIFTVLRIYNFATNCNKYDNFAIENCRNRKNKIYKASHFKVHWVEYLVLNMKSKSFAKVARLILMLVLYQVPFLLYLKTFGHERTHLLFFMELKF